MEIGAKCEKRVGTHFLADLSCCVTNIADADAALELALRTVKDANMTVLGHASATISNGVTQGASAIVLLKESHFTIHTWPEIDFCAMELFTCGNPIVAEESFLRACNRFGGYPSLRTIPRMAQVGD